MTDYRAFYESRAPARERESRRHYHRLLERHYSFLIPVGARVLEVGCGLGDLLAAMKPSRGVGVDFSPGMIARARSRHPDLEFLETDALQSPAAGEFDYLILSDLVNDLRDVQAVLERLRLEARPDLRLVLNFFNTLWRPVLASAEAAGAKSPTLLQNWLSLDDLKNLLHLSDWEVVRTESKILWPANTPFLSGLLNRWLAPFFRHFCLTIFVVARPCPRQTSLPHYSCSVVIPARNEEGNLEAAVRRTPELGLGTEIIFIEGHSRDHTWEKLQGLPAQFPGRDIKILKQQSHGKGGAVREAFARASGELLFILDADLTVPPEDLIKFYNVIRAGAGEFVNGVRLVYPMENQAMRFLNMVANKFFGLAFSWLLGQPVKDTLCGTKVLRRSDYQKIAQNRAYFGDFDPFGDFDLLFGAAKLNLRIVDLPIRYQARTYGETNIQRWRHGWLLLRMVAFAARRLKFIE
jgi:SAM-dependent methyltransferase